VQGAGEKVEFLILLDAGSFAFPFRDLVISSDVMCVCRIQAVSQSGSCRSVFVWEDQ